MFINKGTVQAAKKRVMFHPKTDNPIIGKGPAPLINGAVLRWSSETPVEPKKAPRGLRATATIKRKGKAA